MNYLNFDFEEPHVKHISIGHLGVGKSEDTQYILRTTGPLVDDLGIIIYDHSKRIGGIAYVHFTRIIEITNPEYDLKGRVCRESFRIINNPSWLDSFVNNSNALLISANLLGGSNYNYYYTANLNSISRSDDENDNLKEIVNSHTSDLINSGKIISINHLNEQKLQLNLNEQGLQLNLRTGEFLLFHF